MESTRFRPWGECRENDECESGKQYIFHGVNGFIRFDGAEHRAFTPSLTPRGRAALNPPAAKRGLLTRR
jgi:hypothetical protein